MPTSRSPESATKAQRTRQRLLDSARRVFEENSFSDARISDIADSAGLSVGTFYTYFESKEAIFYELAKEVFEGMFPSSRVRNSEGERPLTRESALEAIARSNEHFIRFYQENRLINAAIESASTYVPEIKQYRKDLRRSSVRRSASAIRRLQESGLVDKDLDPDITAFALVSMISNFVYFWVVYEEEFDIDMAVEHLNLIWARALRLK